MAKELIHSASRNGIGVLTIDSNDQNTLTGETMLELGRKFEILEADASVGAIVLTGHPKSVFSLGADVKEIFSLLKSGDKDRAMKALKDLQTIFLKIENSAKPTVAASDSPNTSNVRRCCFR